VVVQTAEPGLFGDLLRRHRVAAGLSQDELAERAGLSARGISDLERGLRRAPHRHTVAALADALSLTVEERRHLDDAAGPRRRGPTAPPRPDPARTNLPAQTTSFVGRDAEQAAVRRLLVRSRLVTLAGAGGIGKTRLAVETAASLADAYPDGVWLVELAGLPSAGIKGSRQTDPSVGIKGSPQTSNDPALVAQTAARALGIQEEPNRSPLDTLVAAVAGKRLLLILDNCEHVRVPAAEFAMALLQACTEIRLLVTSRQALEVVHETVWRVPSLSLPKPQGRSLPISAGAVLTSEAAQLFCARAATAQPAFALTDENADAVASICQRLDGIPLALELAAARVRMLTPGQIAARLDDRLRLLTRGSPGAPARQQTLRAALDWSYDLLSEEERRLLVRVSVFAGGCDLDAAEAVCADDAITPDPMIDLLTDLVDKSLVVVDYRGEAVRYRLLETVREYAAERLAASGEAEAVQVRLAGWAVELAERAASDVSGLDQADLHNQLEAEHDNLRAVLQWTLSHNQVALGVQIAVALSAFWRRRGHLVEGREWLERLLRQGGGLPPAIHARAQHRAGSLARYQGDFPAATVYLETALALYREVEDQGGICDALNLLGGIARERSEWAVAEDHFEECLSIARTLDDRGRIANALSGLGVVARWQGRLEVAQVHYEEVLEINRSQGDLSSVATDLNNLARIAQMSGDLHRARAGFEEALAIFRRLGNKFPTDLLLSSLAEVVRRLGDLPTARRHAEEALALALEIGDRLGVAYAYTCLTPIARELGDLATAWACATANLELARDVNNPQRVVPALWQAAACAQVTGQATYAVRLFSAVTALVTATNYPLGPSLEQERAAYLAALGATLDDDAFAAAWAEGRAMTADDAVAYALSGTPPSPAKPN
jgi:predicted ATPase/DNA-binding XRE family transcriptional regulator